MRFDEAFANGKFIPDGADYPQRWMKKAQEFRAGLGARARLGLRYGPADRQWFDLFWPETAPAGLMVFIHGGYWMAFGPGDFSHLAAGALARGWAVAMPAYTLAPKARIAAITAEIGTALAAMAATLAGPIVVTGHSAGGHLSARMGCDAVALDPAVAARLRKIAPISPLADLRPLLETTMNQTLRLDLAGARAESPALMARRRGLAVHVWVGGAERPAFLDQARRLGNAWSCPVTVEPQRHHFDVVEGLETADSLLMQMLLQA